MNRRSILAVGGLVGLALSGYSPTQAADANGPDGGWQVTLAPYIFGASMKGSVAVKGQPAEVDLSASDILDHMDFGLMTMVVARKGSWGIIGDALYVNLGVDTDMPPAEVDPSLGIVSLQGVRRLASFADLTFGARWNRVEGSIKLKAPPGIDLERTRNWVDPVVGVVFRTPEKYKWHGTLIADVAGFGVGSDLAWQVFPTAGYSFNEHASIEFGWRILDTDYETDPGPEQFRYDIQLRGPVVGFAWTF